MFQTTLTANVTRDPELTFTTGGKAVVNLSLAHNSRTRDANGQWGEGETTFLEATVWEDMADHVANSLHRGDRVIVAGELTVGSYVGKDGVKHTKVSLRVDEIGPSLRFADAQVRKAARSSEPTRLGDAVQDVYQKLGGRPVEEPAF